MYQQILLVGNLGADPELRFTASATPVATFRMAVSKSWTGQDGQRQEKVTWFRVTCWNKLAETVSQHLSKGRQVMVVGEIEESKPYVDRAGEMKSSIEVRAETVRFLGQKGDGPPVQQAAPQAVSDGVQLEVDIPF